MIKWRLFFIGYLLIVGELVPLNSQRSTPAAAASFYSAAQQSGSLPMTNLRNMGLSLTDIWITAGTPSRTILLPQGGNVHYHVQILNETGSNQAILARWLVSGPCGTVLDDDAWIITPPGSISWLYAFSFPTDICPGTYSYLVSLTHNNEAIQLGMDFDIVENKIFMAIVRR